jgi:transposase
VSEDHALSYLPSSYAAPAPIDAAQGRFDRSIADRGSDPQPKDAHAPRPRKLPRPAISGERIWCRLKDWRRIATHYDKLAANYLAGVVLAGAITVW